MTTLPTIPDFPAHPEDGFQIRQEFEDGYIIWTYSELFNQWTYELVRGELRGFVYTDQVKTREKTDKIMTQKDVNHALAAEMGERIQVLERAVKQLQEIELSRET